MGWALSRQFRAPGLLDSMIAWRKEETDRDSKGVSESGEARGEKLTVID